MKIFRKFRKSKNVQFCFYLLSLISILALLPACAIQPIKIYPDFIKQKQKINTISILCDYYVTDDVKGKEDLVDVPRNLDAANNAMDALDIQLAAKGYNTVGKEVVSMGLYAKETAKTCRIAVDKSPESKEEIEALPEALPPFYVNERLCDTEEKNKIMGIVINKLSEYTRKVGEPVTTIPEVAQIQTGYNEDAIVFLLIQGRDIPIGKSIGQAVATAILTLGILSVAQVSYGSTYLYIVDAKTGEIIWYDSRAYKSRPSSDKLQNKIFKSIVKKIPAR